MAGIYEFSREAVRVKVKKCEGNLSPEWRKFSVDPQITSLEVLYSILAKAFDLKSDFSISYKAIDPSGQEVYLPVLSDWDLDAAFLRAHNHSIANGTDPCLSLLVDIKPFSETSEWEGTNSTAKETTPLQQSIGVGQKYVQNMQTRLPGLIMNQMGKTFSMVTRALNFVEDQTILQPLRHPLSDVEFRSFCDSVGQIIKAKKLRKVIYHGGIDPGLRKVVWKHILNVYPDGMTGIQRMDYIKQKTNEYHRLRDVWRAAIQQGPVVGDLAYVTSMVRKDVLRTDRLHPFYAGNDDNQNIASLFNILTTYALNHPAVSYCQGMSDIASPLLVTMCDEAQAYICFCAIMKRLCTNFMLDGIAMTQKFAHLSEALQFYDPEFYDYLKLQQADDLLFCYRWLLLEMKREFAFEDSLRMLEVLWSSLPPAPPAGELSLFEKEFIPPTKITQTTPICPSTDGVIRKPRETAYTNLCALRRQSSSQSLLPTSPNTLNSMDSNVLAKNLDSTKRLNQSLDETVTRSQEAYNRYVSKTYRSLDESKLQQMTHQNSQTIEEKQENNKLDLKLNNENKQHRQLSQVSPDASDKELPSIQNTNTRQSTANNAISPVSEKPIGTGHFNGLKDRIAAGKKELVASFDKIDKFPFNDMVKSDHKSEQFDPTQKGGKIVKNFNEFLNFASKGAKLTLNRSSSVNSNESRRNSTSQRTTSQQIVDSNDVTENEDVNQCVGDPSSSKSVNKKMLSLNLEDNKQSSFDGSSPDDSEYFPMTTSITRELRLELDNLNRQVFGISPKTNVNGLECTDSISPESAGSHISNNRSPAIFSSEISYTKFNQNSEDETHLDKIYSLSEEKNNISSNNASKNVKKATNTNADIFIWENPLHQLSPTTVTTVQEPNTAKMNIPNASNNPFYEDFLQTLTPDEQNDPEYDGEIIDEATGLKSITPIRLIRKKNDNVSTDKTCKNSAFHNNSNILTNAPGSNQIHDLMNTSILSETNPFLIDINTSTATTQSTESFVNGNSMNHQESVDEEASEADTEINTNIALQKVNTSLPPPHEFGGGNAFLMFLCLALLLQHRNHVMSNNMDYNEMAMHFDKMVRKHNVMRVLNQARRMYAEYIKSQTLQGNISTDLNCSNSFI